MTRRTVRVRRIYDRPAADDGIRVLVDRVWPRRIRKEAAAIDEWTKDAALSTELRESYGHVPEKFAQLEARHRDGLATQTARTAPDHLRTLAKRDALTLVTATLDGQVGHAVVAGSDVAGRTRGNHTMLPSARACSPSGVPDGAATRDDDEYDVKTGLGVGVHALPSG